MKILLVSLDSKFIHANLAVRYLRNFVLDDGYDIEIKEFTINQKEDYILGELYNSKADVFCFSCYIWNIEYIKEIAIILKEAMPNIKILCGGPEVSFEVQKFMEEETFVDYVISGEGEIPFKDFLHQIHSKKPKFKKVNGLSYRENESIIINRNIEPIQDLDVIKYPYLEEDSFEEKIIYYESSRGCPFSCSFCMSSIDKTMRNFSIERVKEDLGKLLKTNARQIKFVDRTFNANYKRSMEIMEFIKNNNPKNMNIHFEITADIINEEFLNYLTNMPVNMFQFEIGIQSLNEETLCEINRHMDIQKVYNVVSKIQENNNIHMHLDLIAGLPYENYESFKKSFDGIHALNVEKIQLGFLKVLKGTKIYEDKEKHKIKYRKTAPYETYCTKYITLGEMLKLKQIEELVDKYYNEKYFEKSLHYILENMFTESPFEFYEEFSAYWQTNDLYKISHGRKKLYEILYKYMVCKDKITDEFISLLRYDFVYNNQREEIPTYLNRIAEEKFRIQKRSLAVDEKFKEKYFKHVNKDDKILNDFRLVDIGGNATIFIYENKANFFNRCKTYKINIL